MRSNRLTTVSAKSHGKKSGRPRHVHIHVTAAHDGSFVSQISHQHDDDGFVGPMQEMTATHGSASGMVRHIGGHLKDTFGNSGTDEAQTGDEATGSKMAEAGD